MAILITLDLVVARKFGGDLELWDRLESRVDHASLNIIVMCLFLLRVYFRRKHGLPSARDTINWKNTLSKITHRTIYLCMAALFITGLITAMNATNPLSVFGAVDVTIGNLDDGFFDFVRQFHEISTKIITALIVFHISAAFYHQIFLRDNVMSRMFIQRSDK